MVQDSGNSFLVTKDRKLFAFKTFKRVYELPNYSNIKLLQCFNDTVYVLITQIEHAVKIQIFSSFNGEADDILSHEFDMSFPSNPASSSRVSEEMCVAFIEGPLSETDSKFFSELLACDLELESISDVLLVSTDDRLLWIKYSVCRSSEYAIETITTAKGNVRGLHYHQGTLSMLHDSTLSVFYLCQSTNILRKREILLDGAVKCFRFHQSFFIYSNLKKVNFVDVANPSKLPVIESVDLKGIVCFTIVENLNFLIAICYNQMFYYLTMPQSTKETEERSKTDFITLQTNDLENIPGVAKFIANEEAKLIEIERKVKELQHLKILLEHSLKIKGFLAGLASVKFHQYPPQFDKKMTIVCKVTNQKAGCEFIELEIQLSKILVNFPLTLMFHRHSNSSVVSKAIKLETAKEFVKILMPAEPVDNAKNKMTLELTFTYDIRGQNKLIVFPIAIKKIVPFDGPKIKLTDQFDECLKAVDKLKLS